MTEPATVVTARDAARAEATREVCEWLARMGDPEDVLARAERQQVTLSAIIVRARVALAAGHTGHTAAPDTV